jgi:Flp pilus assembly pilin Flp
VGVWSRGHGDRLARGQGLVEYGLMLSLTAVVATVILVVFGSQLAVALDIIGSAIESAT